MKKFPGPNGQSGGRNRTTESFLVKERTELINVFRFPLFCVFFVLRLTFSTWMNVLFLYFYFFPAMITQSTRSLFCDTFLSATFLDPTHAFQGVHPFACPRRHILLLEAVGCTALRPETPACRPWWMPWCGISGPSGAGTTCWASSVLCLCKLCFPHGDAIADRFLEIPPQCPHFFCKSCGSRLSIPAFSCRLYYDFFPAQLFCTVRIAAQTSVHATVRSVSHPRCLQ